MAFGATAVQAAPPRAAVTLAGAGSTFVAPVMTGEWIPGYTAAHGGAHINYDAVGSTAGIKSWAGGATDFAASDALLTTAQERSAAARCRSVVKIPVTISAVALIYNVPGVKTGLLLSPAVIANIFLGRVTNWGDPAIKRLNPGRALPNLAIQTAHRSGGSGTTYIITHYLSAVSAVWRRGPGAGATVNWPNGSGAKGSAGMVQTVSTTLGGIGYVDLAFAVQNNLDYATVLNAQGQAIVPGTGAASVAADSFAASMPSDLQQIIVNSPAPGAYPITGYSYIFVCGELPRATGPTLVDFIRYVVTTGQGPVRKLFYAPLPPSVQRLDTAALDRIGYR